MQLVSVDEFTDLEIPVSVPTHWVGVLAAVLLFPWSSPLKAGDFTDVSMDAGIARQFDRDPLDDDAVVGLTADFEVAVILRGGDAVAEILGSLGPGPTGFTNLDRDRIAG